MARALIDVPAFLKQFTGDVACIEVDGATVGECLDRVARRFPGVEPLLFSKSGCLHSHIEIYLNRVSTYPGELLTPVHDGDRISMMYLMVGG